MKNRDLLEGKMVALGRFLNKFEILDRGDFMKNRDFLEGKLVALGR